MRALQIINKKYSIQSIILLMIGLSLVPRILSPYSLKVGTIYILLYWIPMLVIFNDIVSGYESKKYELIQLPKFTISILLFISLVMISTLIFKNFIYEEYSDQIFSNIRRSIYLVNPLICISLFPLIKYNKREYFIILLIILTAIMAFSLSFPAIFESTYLNHSLNSLTAKISAVVMNFFTNDLINVNGNFFGNNSYSIEVKAGCSSVEQIILCINSLVVFYLCCKINSKYKLSIVLFLSIISAFLINSLRIALLAGVVSVNNMEQFEFWHTGIGSLLFSLIIMSLCSIIYYYFWCLENPK